MSTWRHNTSPSIVVGPTVDFDAYVANVTNSDPKLLPCPQAFSEGRVPKSDSMAVHSSALLPPSFSAAEHSKHKLLKPRSLPSSPPPIVSLHHHRRQRKTLRILASVSVSKPEVWTSPDDLVASILSKVYPFTSFSARMSCFIYTFLYFPRILFVPITEAIFANF